MTYTVIGGVNGVGKSGLTGVLREYLNDLGTVVDPNKLIAQTGGSVLKGGKIAVQCLRSCLAQGLDFTQESTLSGSFVVETARAARKVGYTVRLFYVAVSSAEESERRIANRVAHGGHNISERDVERRFSKRFEDLRRLLPLCNEGTFYDNENGFRVVAVWKNGELLPVGNYRPAWLSELLNGAIHN